MTDKVLRIGSQPCRCGRVHDVPAPSDAEFNRRVAAHAKGQDRHDVKAFLGQGVPEPPAGNADELRAAAAETLRNCVASPTNESFNARVRAQRS